MTYYESEKMNFNTNFSELGLDPALVKILTDGGYETATAVQAQTIPAALEGRDLLVSSQTGSGKTAAFLLPALQRLTPNPAPERGRGAKNRFAPAQPKLLVLAPTRELALQVMGAAEKYGTRTRGLKAVAILGGMPYPKQMQLLSQNPEILVATPGRLIDHMNSGKIDFSRLEILVLDEADRMLDMGFIEDIDKIVAATPTARQTLLFSATLDGLVGKVAQRITRQATMINVASTAAAKAKIEQRLHRVDDPAHKNRLLDFLLRDLSIDQALVFTATKRDADRLAGELSLAGFAAAALHGDMHQGARNRTLNALRTGHVRVLVATDVAARGIDVPTISHVFNYDLPHSPEDYVHRIGRTGRAGRAGLAVSLVGHGESFALKNIERYTKQSISVNVVPGYEAKKSAVVTHTKPYGARPGYRGAPRTESRFGKPAAKRERFASR